jgi:hypothetical protein
MTAQTQNTGTVSGNVNDAQGGIVLGATAVLTSTDRNVKVTVTVNERGEYLFPQVTPGVYTLTVTASTFEKFIADTINVNAGENIRIDAPLTRGSASETVTVEAPSTTVDTRSATIATVIDPELVSNLPVDGENVVALAALLPGVTNVNAPTTFTSDTGGPTYNVSGARNNQNLFLLDGVLWNNVYYNTGLNFPPHYMLQEVSVQLNNYKAQYGRNVGSVFNAVTKSGSNQIHGELWDDIQNTMFDAADYFTQHNPHIVENNFGATIGGPIKRDKLFFFLGYSALKGTNEVATKTQTPTLSERGLTAPGVQRPCVSAVFQGQTCATFLEDFQNTASYAGALAGTAGLRNPLYANNSNLAQAISEINSTYAAQGGTGTSPCITALSASLVTYKEYMPNAELPSVCFNPVATTALAKYIPLPNSPSGTGGLPYTNTFARQPQSNQSGFARFDYIRTPHTIGARFYKTETSDTTSNGAIVAAGTTPGVSNYEPDANSAGITAGILDDRWVLTPNMVNTFLAGYKRYVYKVVPTDPTTLINLGGNFTDPGVPALPRLEATNRFQLGSVTSAYSYSLNSSLEADDSLLYTHGHHTLQFGAQYLNLNYIHRFDQTPFLESETQNTQVSAADFLMGLPYQVTVGNSTNYSAVENAFYFYAQDDWRASARLTLNLGMRYELPKPWYQPDGQSVTFVPGYQSYKFPGTPSSFAYQGDPGIPNSIIKTNYTNLAPRFGLAYDAFGNGKTVIRAGFGIFYDTLNANTVGVGAPYHYGATLQQGQGSFSQPLLGAPPVPANYSGPSTAQFVLPYAVNFADANVTQPYTEAVNIGVQQRIAAATLEFHYVGKFGRHQMIPYDLNPAIIDCSGSYFQANPALYCPAPQGSNISAASGTYSQRVKYPNFGYGGQGIVDNNTIGTSNYNGLQVIYTQRSHKSLSTVVSYTYSRSLDDQSNGTTNTAALPLTPLVSTNYGPSDFQATHVLNAGWVLTFPVIAKGNVIERAVLNGWQFGGIFNARTGNPFNPVLSGDQSGTNERPQRPSLNPGYTIKDVVLPSNRHRTDKIAEWFNVPQTTGAGSPDKNCVFYGPLNPCPGLGYTGAIGRNSLYGPAFIETDFNLRRQIDLNERGMRLEFRADAFNVFNTPNLANPLLSLALNPAASANLNAGQIISTVGKNASLGSNGRHLQMVVIFHY